MSEANESSTSSGFLAPSQTINSRNRSAASSSSSSKSKSIGSSGDQGTGATNEPPKNGNKTKRPNRNKNKNKQKQPPPSNNTATSNTAETAEAPPNNNNNNNTSTKKRNNNRNRNRQKQKVAPTSAGDTQAADVVDTPKSEVEAASGQNNNKQKKNQRQRQNRKRQANNKRFPWRRHIPDESVDPITLELLHTLAYPPFALFAEEPYSPISEWPFPEAQEDDTNKPEDGSEETEEQRQERILQEQWGRKLNVKDPNTASTDGPPLPETSSTPNDRHVHLYDGRSLAYYMVSQLQFIDPLNRRDLTRDEIVNLDRYLRRHGFQSLNVTEAYDAKGVTISRAGAAANTAAGRAAILQQEAAVLLNALFGGGPSLPNRSTGNSSSSNRNSSNNQFLMDGYQAHEQQEQRQLRQQRQEQNAQNYPSEDTGIYGDANGILLVDDDLNPGLRGNTTNLRSEAQEFVPRENATNGAAPYTLWSSSHIASQFGHQAQRRAADFPALEKPPAAPATSTSNQESKPSKKPPPKSNTLAKIAVSVKKTDPEERQRMWEAHEAWRKRIAASNLTFGGANPVGLDQDSKLPPTEVSVLGSEEPSEAQLERNRAFAQALGVKPATIRKAESGGSLHSGWSRPTSAAAIGDLDEFGNELLAAAYPDELIMQARERLALLVKLEKRWKLFLEDDKAASLPLWSMDRPTRVFVHQYSDFWRLNTESFDPEPKRYIHCVKLLDTRAPTPLLSEAARTWKGPNLSRQDLPSLAELPRTSKGAVDHNSQQPAGQTTTQASSRWDGLEPSQSKTSPPQERPELKLQKRTLPLELPPYEPPASTNNSDYFSPEERRLRQQRMEEKAQKEREQVQAKQRALEAAFASDSEEDDFVVGEGDDDSEWTQEEEQFQGDKFSDEEES